MNHNLFASKKKRVTGVVVCLPSAFLFLAWLISGCAVGPKYKRPSLDVPPAFRAANQAGTNSFADLPWWQIFQDDTLQSLIRIAYTNNYDIRIAVTRVEQARAIEAEARAGFFPAVNYAGIAGTGRNVGANQTPSPTGTSGTVFAADLNASWEIDLFGRIRRLTESARAQFFASEEARRDVTISLVAEVAQDYFQLLALDRELAIARDATNSFGESLRIFTQRLQGGVASKLETSSAEALMDSAAATIPELERQIQLQENQISVLLGENPGPVLHSNSVIENQAIPIVPAGLPSSLLERRPDVREAEQLLRSANAQVGVAEADFFPQLDLTGLLGQVSTGTSAFTGGGSTAWSVAAGLTGPIFQGGRLRAQYRQAEAARNQFALQYKQTVLNAFQEVSDALISREKLALTRGEEFKAVEAYKEAVKISFQRYQLGQSSYYEVLQEQQQLFPAENTLVQTELNQLVTMVQLYRALGGGWQKESPAAK
jgi:multidrug efflux system outer membrane protein